MAGAQHAAIEGRHATQRLAGLGPATPRMEVLIVKAPSGIETGADVPRSPTRLEDLVVLIMAS